MKNIFLVCVLSCSTLICFNSRANEEEVSLKLKSEGLKKLIIANKSYEARKDFNLTNKLLKQAVQALEKEDSIQLLLIAYNTLGQNFMTLGLADSCLFYEKKSIELNLLKNAEDSIIYADACLTIFENEKRRNNFDLAFSNIEKAGDVIEKINFDVELNMFNSEDYMTYGLTYLILKGDYYYSLKEYELALNLFEFSLSEFNKNEEKYQLQLNSVIRSRIAIILLDLGKDELAITQLKESISKTDGVDINIFNLYSLLGVAYRDVNLDSTIYYNKKSNKGINKHFGTNNKFHNQNVGNIALSYLRKGNIDSAAYYHLQFKEETNPKHFHQFESEMQLRLGNYDSAIFILNNYYKGILGFNSRTNEEAIKELEYLDYYTNLLVEQLKLFKYSQPIFNELMIKSSLLANKIKEYRNSLNRDYASYHTYKRYLKVLNRLSHIEYKKINKDQYLNIAFQYLNDMQAFKYSEKIKTIDKRNNSIDKIYELNKNEIILNELNYQLQIQAENSNKTKLDSLKFVKDSIVFKNNVLKDDLVTKKTLIYNDTISIKFMEESLKPKEVIIDIILLHDYYFFLFIAKEGSFIKLLDKESVDSHLKKIISWQTNPNENKPFVSIDYIKNKLLNEIPSNIEKISIIPDGLFNITALEIFGMFDRKSNYLISYLPSLLSNWYMKKHISSMIKGKMAAFVVDDFNNNLTEWNKFNERSNSTNTNDRNSLSKLIGVQKEINYFKSINSIDIYQSSYSIKSDVIQSIENYKICHFATHTIINKSSPMLSYIQLGKDDNIKNRLDAYEISNLNLNADMVFLSSCNTGIGKEELGEGLQSLAYSFLMAGSKSVIMTQWKIPDETTPEIVISFYKNLKRGMRKSEALQKAKITYLENQDDPLKRHPYFWAGFVLVGDDSPIIFDNDDNEFHWYFFAILLFVGLIVLWINYKKKLNLIQ